MRTLLVDPSVRLSVDTARPTIRLAFSTCARLKIDCGGVAAGSVLSLHLIVRHDGAQPAHNHDPLAMLTVV